MNYSLYSYIGNENAKLTPKSLKGPFYCPLVACKYYKDSDKSFQVAILGLEVESSVNNVKDQPHSSILKIFINKSK